LSTKYYAGIGSRETPEDIGSLMKEMAEFLASAGYTLRSGGAAGADSFFESGVPEEGPKEIYLPWKGFNGRTSGFYVVSDEAVSLAKSFHPRWYGLNPSAKLLIARNSYQVLGLSLNDPVDFIICWTQGGKPRGGTGQALRIASDLSIPVYNLGKGKDLLFIKECLKTKQIPVGQC